VRRDDGGDAGDGVALRRRAGGAVPLACLYDSVERVAAPANGGGEGRRDERNRPTVVNCRRYARSIHDGARESARPAAALPPSFADPASVRRAYGSRVLRRDP